MTAIATSSLTKCYGEVTAVRDLDLTVNRGEVFGFVGPNGAGKSTTISILVGLIRPSAGSATLLDMPVDENPRLIRQHVGVLPERCGLFDRLTGREHLAFAIDIHGDTDPPITYLRRVGLADAADRPTREYSTGMAQRLRLAMALVGNPQVLILDEPAAGLDPSGISRLRDIVLAERDRGVTVFFSSHNLADVGYVSDRVGFLIDGSLQAVVDPQTSDQTLGEHFDALIRGHQ